MAEHAAKEPSMEEILSSIRRIISEGGDETDVSQDMSADAPVSEEDTMSVSEELSEDVQADNDDAGSSDEHLLSVDELLGSDDLDFNDVEETVEEFEELSIEEFSPEVDIEDVAAELDVELEFDVEEPAAPKIDLEDTPMSAPASAPISEPAAATPVPVATAALTGGAGTALEGLVSELMKPVIKEWIDANLPNIVERRVEAEINQIASKVISALRD